MRVTAVASVSDRLGKIHVQESRVCAESRAGTDGRKGEGAQEEEGDETRAERREAGLVEVGWWWRRR